MTSATPEFPVRTSEPVLPTKSLNVNHKENENMSPLNHRDENALEEMWRIRKEAALAIEPETAEVHWEYGVIMDPYREKNLSEAHKQIGRLWFARAPESDISVSFHDLPEVVTRSLQQREIHEEIVKLAQLQLTIEGTNDHDNGCPSDMEALERGMSRLLEAGMLAMLMAARQLLQKKPYRIASDNAETVQRCISLAKHMGASVGTIRRDGVL